MSERLTKLQDNIYHVNKDAILYDIIRKLGVYEETEQNRYELEISELNISPQTYKKLNKKNITYVRELETEHIKNLSPERCKEILSAVIELGLLKI